MRVRSTIFKWFLSEGKHVSSTKLSKTMHETFTEV